MIQAYARIHIFHFSRSPRHALDVEFLALEFLKELHKKLGRWAPRLAGASSLHPPWLGSHRRSFSWRDHQSWAQSAASPALSAPLLQMSPLLNEQHRLQPQRHQAVVKRIAALHQMVV